jgi:hypothetical protein
MNNEIFMRKMSLILASLSLLFSTTGCENAVQKKVKTTQDSFRMTLIDPNSAMFQDVKMYEDGALCGQVNSKNRMGGYVGFTSFYYKDGTSLVHQEAVVPSGGPLDTDSWSSYVASSESNWVITKNCSLSKQKVIYEQK